MASGADKFRFVSPGVQVREIDNSELPAEPALTGPVIIGRTERGPGLRPVEITSFSQFVDYFGMPVAGGDGSEVWRNGNRLAPTYAAYAAQAYLRNSNKITFVRTLGVSHPNATNSGLAGWQIGSAPSTSSADGGAYGLFLIDSGSATSQLTGTLAAIFYLSNGSLELSGTLRGTAATQITGTAVMVASQGSDKEFKALIRNSAGTVVDTISFNFNANSKKFIREVFNTNPTLTNSGITQTSQLKNYFLGETFERAVADQVTSSVAGQQFGVIMALSSGSTIQNRQRMDAKSAKTGWILSQHLGVSSSYDLEDTNQVTRLFRINTLESGEWEQKNLKVSITDIKISQFQDNPYGTFSVVIRKTDDADGSPKIVEQFNNCNLDPSSPNYVARKIGDTYSVWNETQKRYTQYGNYLNNSKYVYVEMNPDVDAGATNPVLLPFGVLGPVRFAGFTAISGASAAQTFGATATGSNNTNVFALGGTSIVRSAAPASAFLNVGNVGFTGSWTFPSVPLRTTSRVGALASPTEAFFGASSNKSDSDRFEKAYVDLVRSLPDGLSEDASLASLEYAWAFSLDDLVPTGSADAVWVSGSRRAGTSFTALSGTYSQVLSAGFNRFTAPLVGGFDGLDITEKEPFNNTDMDGASEVNSYAFNSIKRAINSCRDPEVVDCDLMVVPGITNTGLTDHVLTVCEQRGDCLAIIDLEGGFIPNTENALGDSSTSNRGSVASTLNELRTRNLNTSYGCAYYPWVQIRDQDTGNLFWAPPSIPALGTFSSSQKKTEVWIAPAGFNRGGLSQGAAGIPVINVRDKISKDDRDLLYTANVNPIGFFPGEGIVIFGQKTLQSTRSARDRINVRRMLNYVEKEISRMATRVLFDPNIQVTWDRFLGLAEPFLESVKARFGLVDYKLILDTTTTTPDLVDRNAVYAKLYLKPTKSIEFFVIDSIIVSQGASFSEDGI